MHPASPAPDAPAGARPFTLYLAGFGVFRPDAQSHGVALKALCREYGLDGLYPLDNAAPAHLRGAALARWIYEANVGLIEQADGVLADMNPFRGREPDSGTAFEVGYAIARGKPVWVYTGQSGTLVEQIGVGQDGSGPSRRHVDADGFTVEDFGMNLNLMIACAATVVVGDARHCLQQVVRDVR